MLIGESLKESTQNVVREIKPSYRLLVFSSAIAGQIRTPRNWPNRVKIFSARVGAIRSFQRAGAVPIG